MLPANTVLANRYKLLDQLGTGGAAVVYRAEDLRLGRVVAVKVLRPEFVGNPEQAARFENEARAAAALTAPNVVDVYDYGRDAGTLFIVMQYIDGEDLKQLIRARGPLRPQEAARIAAAVANGLEAAHERGLIHRDVKPQNILIDRHGVVRITDFGVAKALAGPGLTQAGTTYGTAAYLSPEQATGGSISPATDVYALGIVLYEMLCGRPPFDADNVAAVAYKQVYEPPPPLRDSVPDVPPQLEAIVARAMAKDPAARYATAADMAGDLQGFLLTSDRTGPAAPSAAPAPWVPATATAGAGAAGAVAAAPDPVPDQSTAAYQPPSGENGSAYASWSGTQAARRSGPGGSKLAWVAIPLLAFLLLGGFFGGRMLMNRAPGPPASPTALGGALPPPTTPAGGAAPPATASAVAVVPPPAAPTATAEAVVPPPAPTATPAEIAVPRNTPAPPASSPVPATATSKGRPVFATPTPPTGTDRRVALEDLAFADGYRYPPPSIYEGRTAVWIYGQGTSFASMTAPFVLSAQPTGNGHLTLAGMDSEGSAKTPMRILINGQSIFNGANPLPNDYSPNAGTWGTYTWTFPAAVLRPGDNTITIENLAPSAALAIPFIMIDSAAITWDAEQ